MPEINVTNLNLNPVFCYKVLKVVARLIKQPDLSGLAEPGRYPVCEREVGNIVAVGAPGIRF
jgi:hypothetical protein